MSSALRGLGVVVTRPAQQAESLCRLIEAEGGRAIRYPTLEIGPPTDPDAARRVLTDLAHFDLAIFTSANAVTGVMTLLSGQRTWPATLPCLAIGQATGRALKQWGLPVIPLPAVNFTSEQLLELPPLQQVAGQRIVLCKGEGGRERLGDTLQSRGADVVAAVVYRRQRPATTACDLLQYWAQDDIQAIIVTSNESLHNLFTLVGEAGQDRLRTTPLVVVSARGLELARTLGCRHLLLAREASDEALVETLRTLHHQTQFQ